MRYMLERAKDTYAALKTQFVEIPAAEKFPNPEDLRPAEQVYARGNERERTAFHTASKVRNWDSYVQRNTLAKRLDLQCSVGRMLHKRPYVDVILPPIPRRTGALVVRPGKFGALDAAIEEARGVFKSYVPGTMKRVNDSLEGVPRSDRRWSSAINKLATHPEILRVVSNYLGLFPILYRINLLYSPNDDMVDSSSQFWHLDPEDVSQLKIFIWVEDVDKETGPLSALPANLSTRLRRTLDYRSERVTDEQLVEVVGEGQTLEFTGQAGTMAFLDTCRCFHMGSRKGTKPRYAIMLQYVMPYSSLFPLDGELPPPMVGAAAYPPKPSLMDEYLFARKR